MERFRMELESLSRNEEFARVVVAVFIGDHPGDQPVHGRADRGI